MDALTLTKEDINNVKQMWSVKMVKELPEQGESGLLYVLSDRPDYKVYIWAGWWAEIADAASDYQLAKHQWEIHFNVEWPRIKEILEKGKDWTVEIVEVDEEENEDE